MHLRIKEILSDKGITAKEMAEELGMSAPGLSVMLSDKGNPSLSSLERIAGYLGVEMYELFINPRDITTFCPHCGKPVKVRIRLDKA